ncbi:MAG: hypothetical protein ACREBW_05390, partial [Candidatus Micrarchaeaceae archaeon]
GLGCWGEGFGSRQLGKIFMFERAEDLIVAQKNLSKDEKACFERVSEFIASGVAGMELANFTGKPASDSIDSLRNYMVILDAIERLGVVDKNEKDKTPSEMLASIHSYLNKTSGKIGAILSAGTTYGHLDSEMLKFLSAAKAACRDANDRHSKSEYYLSMLRMAGILSTGPSIW